MKQRPKKASGATLIKAFTVTCDQQSETSLLRTGAQNELKNHCDFLTRFLTFHWDSFCVCPCQTNGPACKLQNNVRDPIPKRVKTTGMRQNVFFIGNTFKSRTCNIRQYLNWKEILFLDMFKLCYKTNCKRLKVHFRFYYYGCTWNLLNIQEAKDDRERI